MSVSLEDELSIKYISLISPHLKRSCSHHSQNCAIWSTTALHNTHHQLVTTHQCSCVLHQQSLWAVAIWASTFEKKRLGATGVPYPHQWLALGTRRLSGQASWHPRPPLRHKRSRSDLHGSHCDRRWYPLQTSADTGNECPAPHFLHLHWWKSKHVKTGDSNHEVMTSQEFPKKTLPAESVLSCLSCRFYIIIYKFVLH